MGGAAKTAAAAVPPAGASSSPVAPPLPKATAPGLARPTPLPPKPSEDDSEDATTISAKALLQGPGPAPVTRKTVPPRPPSPRKVSSAPPPPPPKVGAKPGPGAGPVDIDWDDEDEKTTVFDRGSEDASRSLLNTAPPLPAAGAPPPATVPPPPFPQVGKGPLPRPSAPPGLAPAMDAYPQQPRRGMRTLLVAILVVGAALAGFMLMPKTGSLLITVSGPENKPIDALQVLLDDKQVCKTSPCRLEEVTAGLHVVKVAAAGYESTAPQGVKVSFRGEQVVNITLAEASEGTGLRVAMEGAGLTLSVDGKEVGPLPQELKDMKPGSHQIRIDGSERYSPFEETVRIERDKIIDFEPELKVLKGLATIKPGDNADGARVLLVSGNERRPIPKVPIKVDITTDKPYKLVATKTGFRDFEEDITFDDGKAEKTFVIDLVEAKEGEVARPVARAPVGRRPAARRAVAAPRPKPKEEPSSGGGQALLTLTSTPPSNVILDGRPLGKTPKINYPVDAGTHSVVFVHPEKGRRATSIKAAAGKTTRVAAKF